MLSSVQSISSIRRLASAVSIGLVIALAACTPAEEPPAGDAAPVENTAAATPESPAAPAAETSTAPPAPTAPKAGAGSGSIHGLVKFDGPRPQPVTLDTKADPKCAAMHKDSPLVSQQQIVSEAGEVAHVFVYVANPPKGEYAAPAEPIVLNQEGCEYHPHVFGMFAGQNIEIQNNDPTLHNVRSFTTVKENKPFNLGQPEGSAPRMKTFAAVEKEVKFKCDVHPWMTAFAFVMDHPFFAVTDEKGMFDIKGLPAGTYTLTAWHEKYGEKTAEITVKDGEAAQGDFTFSPAAK